MALKLQCVITYSVELYNTYNQFN